MNIREISKPVTAKALNESLAKRFGKRIALETFTLEQLQNAQNKLRTDLFNVETTESFNSVQREAYQKSKLFLDVLNAEIAERENIGEGAKPDFLDMDKDGDKKEPMKKAIKDKKKKKVSEGAEEQAELVMAAKDMVNRITGWMEDTAEMQTESMLELADAIRDELGSEKSEAFTNAVKPSLEAMYTAIEATREATTQGVGLMTGEEMPEQPMGDEVAPEGEAEMEPTVDAEAGAIDAELPADDDGMGAADAAVGGEEEAGRAKRESVERSRRLGTILSKKK